LAIARGPVESRYSFASTLAVPSGITPKAVSLPISPFATSAIVPSPPAATTMPKPSRAASRASSVAWPACWVSATSTFTPFSTSRSRTRQSAVARRRPATGLKITNITRILGARAETALKHIFRDSLMTVS